MKIAILTSGGDAPGMNAAIRAVVRTADQAGIEVLGIRNGYAGLVENDFIELKPSDVSGFLQIGGTFLGTNRLKEFVDVNVQKIAKNNLIQAGVDYLITIGGNGTYQGALALSKLGVNTIGIPATIDNDLGGTDSTIGFSTALNTIMDAIDKLRDTSSSHHRCSVIETMGRGSSELAIYSAICGGAEYVITHDKPFDKTDLMAKFKEYKRQNRKHAIVVVSEKLLNVHELAEEISKETGFNSRATVLGYVQRGGSPSQYDRFLATSLGVKAVELVKAKATGGLAVGLKNSEPVSTTLETALLEKRDHEHLFNILRLVS